MKRIAKRIVALTTLVSFTATNTLAALPNLQSIQGVNPDGRYNSGDTIEITAKFDDFVSPSPQSELSLTLDVGPTTVDVPLTFSSDSLRDSSFGIAGVDNATGYGDASSEGIVMATELKQGDNAGRIVIVGSFTSYEGTSGVAKILVLNPDGTIYKSFLNTTSEFTNAIISTVYETSQGKILVGGEFENVFGNANYDFLVQLNADFTVDTAFMNTLTSNNTEIAFNDQVGSSGTANGANYYSANTPIVEHNGRLYIGGDFTQVGGQDYDHVTCLNLDGSFCSGFSSPFTLGTRAMSLAIDGDKLWVAGQNMYAGSYQDLWRLNLSDGSVDNTYVNRLGGDLIGGIVVLPEVADGGTGGLAISGNSLDMDAHATSTDNT
ncbi:MAG: delta-60 repeat domain-containing protein, partial [Thalassolituus sp.]